MIDTRTENGVAVLTMNHGKVNAMNFEFNQVLAKNIREQAESVQNAVVLTGSGSAFSAGVDLPGLLEEGPEHMAEFYDSLVEVFEVLYDFPKPLVAAVNGHAIAGGCVVAAACDYRILAAGRSLVGLPELKVGVPFPAVAMEILRGLVPPSRLGPLMYEADNLDPEAALAAGLVEEVAPTDEVLPRAIELASSWGALDAGNFTRTKRELRAPGRRRMREDAGDYEAEVRRRWAGPDVRAAIGRYVEATLRK